MDYKIGLIIIIIVVIIVIIIMGLFILQSFFDSKILYPKVNHVWSPENSYENIWVGNLHGWWFNNSPYSKTVVFCHGNAGNISYKSQIVDICKDQNLNLIMFDYTGYGKSKGKPSQTTLLEDASRYYKYILTKIPKEEIVIWGESLGGYIASYLAATYGCSSLILLSAFSSVEDVLSDKPFLYKAMSKFVDKMRTKKLLTKVKCPVFIMHSKNDDLIGYFNAEINYNSITHDNKLLVDIGGSHSRPLISRENIRTMFNFCGLDNSRISKIDYILEQIKNREPIW